MRLPKLDIACNFRQKMQAKCSNGTVIYHKFLCKDILFAYVNTIERRINDFHNLIVLKFLTGATILLLVCRNNIVSHSVCTTKNFQLTPTIELKKSKFFKYNSTIVD